MNKKLRILVVDDNIISLATLEQELKRDYEVITVNSGVRAIRFLKQEKPDLILLDVQMALKNGIETLEEIRNMENGASMPVIMLTSKSDRDTIIRSSKLGAVDYVLKPFDAAKLKERIHQALKKSGAIPAENRELYEHVKSAQKMLWNKNTKGAIAKIEELLNYKLDEEIIGRLESARTRLSDGDDTTARRLLYRILKILERNMNPDQPDKLPFDPYSINGKLQDVLKELKNFKVGDATQKLEDILFYDMPTAVGEPCEEAMDYLREYDDGAAESLIREALQALKGNRA